MGTLKTDSPRDKHGDGRPSATAGGENPSSSLNMSQAPAKKRFTLRTLGCILENAARLYGEDNVPRMAAAFAFFAVLSLSPFTISAVAVAGSIIGKGAIEHWILGNTASLGKGGVEFMQNLIEHTYRPQSGIVAGSLSVIVAIFGASNLFLALDESVTTIWQSPRETNFFRWFLVARSVSIAMTFVFFATLLAWVGLDTWLGYLARTSNWSYGPQVASIVGSFIYMFSVCALVYKIRPANLVSWKDASFGAFFAATGIILMKYLLSLYFAFVSQQNAYGFAGTLLIILLWVFYSAQFFFFGIELTYAYAHLYGSQAGKRHFREAPHPDDDPPPSTKVVIPR